MISYPPYERAIARVEYDRKVLGAAFLISDRHLITCSHVVEEGGKVDLQFLANPGDEPIRATVTAIRNDTDVAVIVLDEAIGGTAPAPIARWAPGEMFRATGFPDKSPKGDAIEGKLQGSNFDQWVKLECTSDRRIGRRFSGTGVWSDASQTVVGMIVAYYEDEPNAYMIPMERIAEILEPYPEISKILHRGLSESKFEIDSDGYRPASCGEVSQMRRHAGRQRSHVPEEDAAQRSSPTVWKQLTTLLTEHERLSRHGDARHHESLLRHFFLTALYRAIETWLPGRDQGGADRVFVDTLCESLVLDEGPVKLVRFERRFGRDQDLVPVLENLLDLEDLIGDKPEFLFSLSYRVVTTCFRDFDPSVFVTRRITESSSNAAASSLRQLQSKLRFTEEVNPHDTLLETLFQDLGYRWPIQEGDFLEGPLECIEGWLAGLLNAASKGKFDRAVQEIGAELQSLHKRQRGAKRGPKAHLVTRDDRPPALVVRGDYPTYVQPNLDALRKGYFASRRIYGPLREKAVAWLDNDFLSAQGSKIHIFWLSGTFGAGKSVALLYLLADLHRLGYGPILQLRETKDLPKAIGWAHWLTREGRRLVIAADDPFTQDGASQQTWADAVQEIREQLDEDEIPLFLFCGLRERAEALKRNPDFSVELFHLPAETPEDLEELRYWYHIRTGLKALQAPAGAMPLAIRLFEWKRGDSISDFAKHLKRLLLAADSGASDGLYALMTDVLALYRFGIYYPRGVFIAQVRSEHRKLLNKLEKEGLLHGFSAEPPGEEPYGEQMENGDDCRIWLFDPNVSRVIYEIWTSEDWARATWDERGNCLKRTVKVPLQQGANDAERLNPLRGLVSLLGTETFEQVTRDAEERDIYHQLLASVYTLVAENEGWALTDLALWVNAEAACRLELNPRPVDLALEVLDAASEDFDVLPVARQLLAVTDRVDAGRGQAIRERIVSFLEDSAAASRRGWLSILIDAISGSDDPRFRTLARRWLERHPFHHPAWGAVFEALWQHPNERDSRLHSLARRWLFVSSSKYLIWQRLWIALHKSEKHPDLVAMAGKWLEGLEKQDARRVASMHGVLKKVKKGNPDYTLLARCWLATAPPDHGFWGWVWLALWSGKTGNSYLVKLAREWLAMPQVAEHPTWSFVWETLRDHLPDDPQLTHEARRWLSHAPQEHQAWQYVFKSLRKDSQQDRELVDLAKGWLGEAYDHHSWWHAWLPLWKQLKGDPELVEITATWLNENLKRFEARKGVDNSYWAPVWLKLWRHSPHDPLEEQALRWLSITGLEDESWGYVWREMWKTEVGDRTQLDGLARRFLASPSTMGHRSWPYVWRALWAEAEGDTELVDICCRWLSLIPTEHEYWGSLWLVLRGHLGHRGDLEDLARSWLGAAPGEHAAWAQVWQELWKDDTRRDAEVARLGNEWLSATTPRSRDWHGVWQDLWAERPSDRALREIAGKWLEVVHTKNHEVAAFVWGELSRVRKGSPESRALLLNWLNSVDAEHVFWKEVWQALWELDPREPELEAMAREWLASPSTWELSDWTFVWQELWRSSKDKTLAELGESWTRVAREHESWQYIWDSLWKRKPGDRKLNVAGRSWLALVPEHHSWWYTWNRLWEAAGDKPDDELVALTLSWLARPVSTRNELWGRAWLAIWRLKKGQDLEFDASAMRHLVRLARSWLAAVVWKSKDLAWGWVWSEVWRWDERNGCAGQRDLVAVASRNLSQAPGKDNAWGRVWLTAWEAEEGDPELGETGCRWLKKQIRNRKAQAWPYTWLKIWKSGATTGPLRAQARALGDERLEISGEWDKHWGKIWKNIHKSLRELPDDRDRFEEQARSWLVAYPTNDGWGQVWEVLWDAQEGDPELRGMVCEWLRENPDTYSWASVVFAAGAAALDDPEVRQLAERRLREGGDQPGWSFLLQAFWKEPAARQELSELAFEWLKTKPSEASWGWVWGGLWTGLPEHRDKLLSLTLTWLDEQQDNKCYGYVWKEVWTGVGDEMAPVLEPLGRNWLHGKRRTTWGDVWRSLWDANPDDELARIARTWLLTRSFWNQNSWGLVWEALWEASERDPELTALGCSWLKVAAPDHESRERVRDQLGINDTQQLSDAPQPRQDPSPAGDDRPIDATPSEPSGDVI